MCRRSVLALPSPEEAKRGRFAYNALPAAQSDRNESYADFGNRTLKANKSRPQLALVKVRRAEYLVSHFLPPRLFFGFCLSAKLPVFARK